MQPPVTRQAYRPARIDPLPGTPFGVMYPMLRPTVSGFGSGALVAGLAAVLVSFVVVCLGSAGAGRGWGALVSGAFAILAVLLGTAAIVAGVAGRRQASRSAGGVTGGGLALSGLCCGASAIGVTLLGFLLAVLLAG